MFDFNDDMLAFALSHADNDPHSLKKKEEKPKNDLMTEECMEIYNEIIEIFRKHNVSYECACRLSLSLTYAMVSGQAEIYNQESLTGL